MLNVVNGLNARRRRPRAATLMAGVVHPPLKCATVGDRLPGCRCSRRGPHCGVVGRGSGGEVAALMNKDDARKRFGN